MPIPLDRLKITDLMARTYVGFNDWEQEKKQDVAISLTLHADLSRACRSDDVADTVDYKDIKKQILALVEGGRFMLIEKMAADIADICLAAPAVERVDVVVDKLQALRFARSVQVAITREKDHSTGSSDG
jgi:FolB domain-containing protein